MAFATFIIVLIQQGFTLQLAPRLPALVLVALFITTGLQLFFFGFVLQLLKQIKRNVDRAPSTLRIYDGSSRRFTRMARIADGMKGSSRDPETDGNEVDAHPRPSA